MIKKNSTFFLGIFIFLIPFLGLPTFWKTTFIILSGVVLVGLSVKFTLPKKSVKNRPRREKVTPVFVENSPIQRPAASLEAEPEMQVVIKPVPLVSPKPASPMTVPKKEHAPRKSPKISDMK